MLEWLAYASLAFLVFRPTRVLHPLRVTRLLLALAFLGFPTVLFLVMNNASNRYLILAGAALLPASVFAVARWRAWSLKFVVPFGFFLNSVVIAANGGWMPANVTFVHDSDWVGKEMNADTKLPWLGDIFSSGLVTQDASFHSIGDVFIFSGLVLAAAQSLRKKHI